MHRAIRAILDLLWPQDVTCALCGCELEEQGEPLCAGCDGELTHGYGHACPGCGRPMTEPGTCRVCRQSGAIADRSLTALAYEGRARSVVIAFKLQDRTGYAPMLAHWMVCALREAGLEAQPDCVVPVPMHWRRRFHRGYNQSELLAAEIAHAIDRPMLRRVLTRPIYTRPSVRLRGAAAARTSNAERSYSQGQMALQGRAVLLVDDILTTGATLRACTALLRAQGAAQVIALVAAAVPEGNAASEISPLSPPARRL